jgi:hypothetical protein
LGVIEVASLPMLARGPDGLKNPAVEANGVATRAEWNPIQIHWCCARCVHCADEPAVRAKWPVADGDGNPL